MEKTRLLARWSDGCFVILTGTGHAAGVASELTTLQVEQPEGARNRVVFRESTFPLSAILDAEQEGVLGAPPVPVVEFASEDELLRSTAAYAHHLRRYGSIR